MTQAPMTQAPMTETDPREIHQRAMVQTELIVAAVEPGQLTLPTPCADYDVGALLSHIVGGLNRIALMGEGADAMAAPPLADGVPDDGWLAAYRTARARVIAAWADDARLDAVIEVPWGKVPGRIALSGYVQEIAAHGWDLAKATGQPTELEPRAGHLGAGYRAAHPPGRAARYPGDSVRPGCARLAQRRSLRPDGRLAWPPALTHAAPPTAALIGVVIMTTLIRALATSSPA